MIVRVLRDFVLTVMAIALGLTAGCGGPATVAGPGSTGQLVVRVVWPQSPDRHIPTASRSIRFRVRKPGASQWADSTLVAYPATEGTLDRAPVGQVELTATAYPNSDGTGQAQATGTVSDVQVTIGQNTAVGVTLASTVTSVRVQASTPSLTLGATARLTATARDASSQTILIAPSAWQWSSSDDAVATVRGSGIDSTAVVTPVAAGRVTLTAVDADDPARPVTGALVLEVMQPASFAYSSFSGAGGLRLQGVSALSGNALRLASLSTWKVGSAWYATQQSVSAGFDTTFQFCITGSSTMADGFAFVIQNASATALGSYAEAVGYGSYQGGTSIANSLAVEFDVYQNYGENDPDDNHISVHTRGSSPNSADESYAIGRATPTTALADGRTHTARIRLRDGRLQITLDNQSSPLVSVPYSLATGGAYLSEGTSAGLSLNSGQAWVGFTASTGTYSANFDILSWSFVAYP